MINIGRKLLRSRVPFLTLTPLRHTMTFQRRPLFNFSSEKDDKRNKKDMRYSDEISLADIWQQASKKGQSIYYEAKKVNKVTWGLLACLPFLYLLLREEDA